MYFYCRIFFLLFDVGLVRLISFIFNLTFTYFLSYLFVILLVVLVSTEKLF